jgi:hypothetical protein
MKEISGMKARSKGKERSENEKGSKRKKKEGGEEYKRDKEI